MEQNNNDNNDVNSIAKHFIGWLVLHHVCTHAVYHLNYVTPIR